MATRGKDGPRTTAIVPAYRSERTLLATTQSALAQTEERLEVIVVDDASPVPAVETLRGLRDPRLRIIRHRRNRGVSAARNTAIAAARSPLVSQLDSDDLWEPDYVESVAPLFDDPEVGLVYTNGWLIGHPEGRTIHFDDSADQPIQSFRALAEANVLLASSATMRRAAVEAVGGYPWWLRLTEEWHLYLKLMHADWRFGYVDRTLVHYRFPQYGRHWYDKPDMEHEELRMWLGWLLRDPLHPPRGQLRWRVEREARRLRRGRGARRS